MPSATQPTLSTKNILVSKIPYSKIPQLSKRDLTYILENENLRPFYKYLPRIESFEQVFNLSLIHI